MTLKGKLILNTVAVVAGIAILVGVSVLGALQTRQRVEQLTLQSSPLQARTLELMQRLEKTSSSLLRLGLVVDSGEARRLSAEVERDLAQIASTVAEMEKLGQKSVGLDIEGLRRLHQQVMSTVERRLQDVKSFNQEAGQVNQGLMAIDESATALGKGAAALNAASGQAAEESRIILTQSSNAIKKLLTLQSRLKSIEVLFGELDTVRNRFRLTPLKERLKALDDSVQALTAEKDDPAVVTEARSRIAEVHRAVVRDGGLMALRAEVLTGKDGAETAYQTQRSGLLQSLGGVDTKIAEAVDQMEIQLLRNRQKMEAAFKQQAMALQLITRASGINVDSKELNSGVRRIMLAVDAAEVNRLSADMKTVQERMAREAESARSAASTSSELQRALAAVQAQLQGISSSIDKIAQTKTQMLTSEQAMQSMFAKVRAISQEQSHRGEQQVSAVKLSQQDIVEQINRSASTMLAMLLAVAAAVSVLVLALSVGIVRSTSRQLGALVDMVGSVARTGNFSLRVAEEAQDEVGQTVRAFNALMDRLQNAIDETNRVMAAISAGRFDERIQSDLPGDLGRLKLAVNNSASAMQCAIDATNQVMSAISAGRFNERIDADMAGDLARLKTAVNSSAGAMQSAIDETNQVLTAISAGRFDVRIRADMAGDLARLKAAVNSSAGTMQSAIKAVAHAMQAMAEGDLTQGIQVPLQGELDGLKQAVNDSLAAVRGALSEVNRLVAALASGDLDQRIELPMAGEFATLKDSINRNADSIRAALGEVGELMGCMASGDLTRRAQGDYPGAFGALTAYANEAVNKLAETVEEIQTASTVIHQGTGEIAQGNADLSSRSEQQAASLEQTAASMEELASTVKQNSDSAQQASRLAREAAHVAELGGGVVRQVAATMADVQDSSLKIASITEMINTIAFQTNILALNAAVEAARVGEHGKGFAVVAVEVRSLAQRCSQAAAEIKQLIDESGQRVAAGNALASEAGARMEGIVTAIQQVNRAINDISNASVEQIQGIEQVNRAIVQLEAFTTQNVSLVENASKASSTMQAQAEDLAQTVSLFRVAY